MADTTAAEEELQQEDETGLELEAVATVDGAIAKQQVMMQDFGQVADLSLEAEAESNDNQGMPGLIAEESNFVDEETEKVEANVEAEIEKDELEPEKTKPKSVNFAFASDSQEGTLIEDIGYDSNGNESDEEDFIRTLSHNKRQRYSKRKEEKVDQKKYFEDEKNKGFIDKMINYLRDIRYSTNANKKSTTLSKTRALLFTNQDAWLSYMINSNPDFSLDKLLIFHSSDLQQIKNPLPWMNMISGPSGQDNPGPRRERLKAFHRMKNFLMYEVENTDFDPVSEQGRGKMLLDNLKEIDNLCKRERIWSNLEKLEKAEARDKQTAMQILNPSNNKNTVDSVKNWFASSEFKEMLQKHNSVWENASVSEKVDGDDLTKFALFARFITMLLDRNRAANYRFTNSDLICAAKLWYPPTYQAESYVPIPSDWDVHKPDGGRQPDALQLKLSGKTAGLKGNIGTTVTIQGVALQLCNKYRDLKELLFSSEEIKPESCFFVNSKGEPLSDIQNTPGSLLEKFGRVTGIQRATVTQIRKALDSVVQRTEVSRKRINVVANHSEDVSLSHYDLEGSDARSEFMFQLSQAEGGHVDAEDPASVPDHLQAKRRKRDEEDQAVREAFVKETLAKSSKNKQPTTLSKTTKIYPQDRVFMQELLTKKKYYNLHPIRKNQIFPGRTIAKMIIFSD